MGRRSAILAIAAGLCFGPVSSLCRAEEPQSTGKADRWNAWTGLSAGPNYIYGYVGAGMFVIGDADDGGLVARLGMGGGGYRTAGDNPHDVVQYDAHLMLGYRTNADGAMLGIYAGAISADTTMRTPEQAQAAPNGASRVSSKPMRRLAMLSTFRATAPIRRRSKHSRPISSSPIA